MLGTDRHEKLRFCNVWSAACRSSFQVAQSDIAKKVRDEQAQENGSRLALRKKDFSCYKKSWTSATQKKSLKVLVVPRGLLVVRHRKKSSPSPIFCCDMLSCKISSVCFPACSSLAFLTWSMQKGQTTQGQARSGCCRLAWIEPQSMCRLCLLLVQASVGLPQ